MWGATGVFEQSIGGPYISIHAPRVGSDYASPAPLSAPCVFQSTLPVWGAPHLHIQRTPLDVEFQSTLPVWGAPGNRWSAPQCSNRFQSTLPVWGATSISPSISARWLRFQSTLPVWGATSAGYPAGTGKTISIHAPRVGSDWLAGPGPAYPRNFNPRSPCGERQTGA